MNNRNECKTKNFKKFFRVSSNRTLESLLLPSRSDGWEVKVHESRRETPGIAGSAVPEKA